VGFLVGFVGLY